MSVTQYIGARYVPLFADPAEWDNTRAYEPLTVVLHQGASYTSRQAVPIGIEIENADFWVLTGNYNAQVEAYRQEVQHFAGDIQEAQDAAASAQEAVSVEATARENADEDLQEAIEIEATARENADEDLQEAIEIEATARQNADGDLQEAIKLASIPTFYYPQHIGDFIIPEKPGCVCRNEDNYIVFSAKDNVDGTGTITVCDLATNSIRKIANMHVEHANSCANDTVRSRIWLAPMMTKSGTAINKLYWLNYQLSAVNEMSLNFSPQGISFDPTTSILWACSWVVDGKFNLYKMEENETEFSFFGSVDNALIGIIPRPSEDKPLSGFQDFAVYDGIAYFNDTVMNLQIANLETLQTVKMATIGNQSAQWRYGEPQGIEFDELGNFLHLKYTSAGFTPTNETYALCMASVTKLTVAPSSEVSGMAPFRVSRDYGINATSQTQFTNERYELKTANFLRWLVSQPATINYHDTIIEPYRVYPETDGNLAIQISNDADVSFEGMQLSGGKLLIYVASGGTIRFRNANNRGLIQASASRAADFSFSNLGTWVCPVGNSNITQFGYNGGIITYTYAGTIIDANGASVTPQFNEKEYATARKLIIGSRYVDMVEA